MTKITPIGHHQCCYHPAQDTYASPAPYKFLYPCPVDSRASATVYVKIKTDIPQPRQFTDNVEVVLEIGEKLVDTMRLVSTAETKHSSGQAADKQTAVADRQQEIARINR